MSKLGKALLKAVEEAKFAKLYHISPETIKKWEQHKREPDAISRAYLKYIEKAPDIIKVLVNS